MRVNVVKLDPHLFNWSILLLCPRTSADSNLLVPKIRKIIEHGGPKSKILL